MDSAEDFRELDRREVGCEKIDVTKHVSVVAVTNGSATKSFTSFRKKCYGWCMYHVLKTLTRQINFPVCQTYVDTVLEVVWN